MRVTSMTESDEEGYKGGKGWIKIETGECMNETHTLLRGAKPKYHACGASLDRFRLSLKVGLCSMCCSARFINLIALVSSRRVPRPYRLP